MSAPEITYEVYVDWDGTDWQATPDFSEGIDDISNDVSYIDISRGKEREEGNAPASFMQVKMKSGLHAKYSLYNTGSVLYGKIRPWLVIRARAVHSAVTYPIFFGFISSIKVNPHLNKQSVTIYATDGMDVLARQLITQDYEDRTVMTDGAAVGLVADAAGWSATKRDIDVDGGDILNYPAIGRY